ELVVSSTTVRATVAPTPVVAPADAPGRAVAAVDLSERVVIVASPSLSTSKATSPSSAATVEISAIVMARAPAAPNVPPVPADAPEMDREVYSFEPASSGAVVADTATVGAVNTVSRIDASVATSLRVTAMATPTPVDPAPTVLP